MPRHLTKTIVFAALAAFAGPVACAQDSGDEGVSEYVDGRGLDTDDGFHAVLWSDAGEPVVGENTFYLRLGMPEPGNDEGKGIPGAFFNVRAIPMDDAAPTDHRHHDLQWKVMYEGDGVYKFSGIEIDRRGEWELVFDFTVGETIEDSVAFAFRF